VLASLAEFEVPRLAPFVKWAGGKSQLLTTFEERRCFPSEFGTYYEPFLGGGAVFFYLYSKERIKSAVISDLNKDLINSYIAIRDHLDELLSRLRELQKHARNKEYFYDVARKSFNNFKLKSGEEGDIEKAALLFYLNKTCFNGLYRVNRRGEFNVPWGEYRNPRIYDELNLRAVKTILKQPGIEIRCGDYTRFVKKAKAKDFVYFDPPYQPLSSTASFTAYTAGSFSMADQEKLARWFHRLSSRGCYVMLSNSPRVQHLYENQPRVETVKAARAISSVGTKRGPIDELVVMNYDRGQFAS
jgi:DNA adenine methylase